MDRILRNVLLYLSNNRYFTEWARKHGRRLGASRFVAGEDLDSAVRAIRKLNEAGLCVTVDHLGEFIQSERDAREMSEECVRMLRAIHTNGLDAELSLKLTSMGLDLPRNLALENMRFILDEAKKYNIGVTIDMEDYSHCQQTLEIFKELKREYSDLGTVLQAYLYRTEEDLEHLQYLNPALRLVKGAYKESADVAFASKKDVDENFKKIIDKQLLSGNYTAIATHDDSIIEYAKEAVNRYKIKSDQFEFQMLFGIRSRKQLQLVSEGYKMRVYVPYGTDWFGYFMRRMAERPANVLFVMKGIFSR
ncbi:proline dehydrogenase family protein [Bacillus massiliglaciei]|uniref:proline dehydrogenase family protein n=1 Tax=Bacillus massiliglaciei TaxID=1816693 RepID=UPI000AADCEA9|nr:proline dehydrogenase family protein [Bacillus massiliglaciei]